MPKKTTAQAALLPNFKLLIENKAAAKDLVSDILSITVSEDLDAVGMFEIAIEAWDDLKQELAWLDDSLLALGSEVEIQMGFNQDLKTVFIGQITGLEPEFRHGENPKLVVRGHDRRHLLLRGKKTKSFAKMSDAAIAKKIAEIHGLTPKVVETQPKLVLESVLQHNQTDYEFLSARAKRIGYELMVEGKTLHFRPHSTTEKEVMSFSAQKDLLEFLPRLTTMTQLPRVEVRGWSVKDKEAIVGMASTAPSKLGGKMGGKQLGTVQTKKAFGSSTSKASHTVVTESITTKAEADLLATGQQRDMAIAFITAEVTCGGLAILRAGSAITITDAGSTFSGVYYLTAVEHTYSEENGYETKFTARRNST
ncbi:phage late control D family protein [[Limnothrix rosea] IAM M-220]|uniref:phage late control D family protein n=1 Tax=[Limnothrix rosea] IAM M-220 TaxID=454133 RepID=UPI00096691C7|nr:contractile injection system protein, VgrG/Pvc8 family [[Limnothrix rosea] IAM M-220]OKH18097.1 hypothetical protein NIES208_07070 [[Limnothrix rosea] IAM M-220]